MSENKVARKHLDLRERKKVGNEMRLVQMKPVQGLFLAKEKRPLKIVPWVLSIPLAHQLMDPLHKELLG
jgi:hypothetical protein